MFRSIHLTEILFGEVPFHGVRILAVSVILGLDLTDGELERVRVEIERGPVTFSNMQRNVFGLKTFHHGIGRLIHQLLRQSQPSMRSFHRQRRDVTMRVIRTLFFHFGENVAHNLSFAIFCHVT